MTPDPSQNNVNQPLLGIKVLDLSRVLAGPLCAMMLGDMGANVIKVERPGLGDETRGWGPPFDHRGESAYFLSTNRNKKSIAADLASAGDRDFILGLCRTADVVIENFRRGVLARLGIDPALARADNPELVWLTITGFGPESDRPGYDFVVQAERGWMAISGEQEGPPLKSGVALVDVITGKDAVAAVLAALVARARTGVGAHVSVSLSRSATAALVNVAQNVMVSGQDAGRWGNAHPNLVPYQLFSASDRPIVIAVGSDGQWKSATQVLGLASLADDQALAANAGRLAHRERIVRAIADRVRTRSAGEWIAKLDAAGVPCGIVRGVAEALAEEGGASAETGPASPIPGLVRYPPPRLDEHGPEIRRWGWEAFRPDAMTRVTD